MARGGFNHGPWPLEAMLAAQGLQSYGWSQEEWLQSYGWSKEKWLQSYGWSREEWLQSYG